jgi:arabinose-5-phosphate isomerase
MRKGQDVPRATPEMNVSELMRAMSVQGFGAAAVMGSDGRAIGIFTDGDLRRLVETGADLRTATAAEVMHRAPRTIRAGALAVEAAELMEQHGITRLFVTDADDLLVGALNTHDLMRAKVI